MRLIRLKWLRSKFSFKLFKLSTPGQIEQAKVKALTQELFDDFSGSLQVDRGHLGRRHVGHSLKTQIQAPKLAQSCSFSEKTNKANGMCRESIEFNRLLNDRKQNFFEICFPKFVCANLHTALDYLHAGSRQIWSAA